MRKKSPNVGRREIVIEIVCNDLGVDMYKIRSSWRKAEIVQARQILCYILYKYCNLSLKGTGAVVNKDHTTVINCIRRVRDYIETEPEYRSIVTRLVEKILSST